MPVGPVVQVKCSRGRDLNLLGGERGWKCRMRKRKIEQGTPSDCPHGNLRRSSRPCFPTRAFLCCRPRRCSGCANILIIRRATATALTHDQIGRYKKVEGLGARECLYVLVCEIS